MNKFTLLLLSGFTFFSGAITAQVTIKGKVTEGKNKPVSYATIYVKNTIVATLSDTLGNYILRYNTKENVTVVATAMGYDTTFFNLRVDSSKVYVVNIALKSNSSTLEEVVISPGAIEANNDRKVAVLTTMDVYTTAGAEGDILGAIQTLPGVQRNPDETGLFVRGGDATESSVIVDGLVVQDPFFSDVPGVAQRSRFAPYEFSGMSFSSGGYSARYGQALSGILELNTNDLPEQSTINLGVNMAGIDFSGTKLWTHSALEGDINYINLQPFYGVVKSNLDFYQPPVGIGGSVRYIWTNTNGDVLKISFNYNQYKSGTDVINPDQPDTTLAFNLRNYYGIGSVFYRHFINSRTFLTVSSSYSQNADSVKWGIETSNNSDEREQSRIELGEYFSKNLFWCVGTDIQRYSEKQVYDSTNLILNLAFTEMISAGYTEAEWKPVTWFGLKAGVRYEYSQILAKSDVAPRISAAIRLNKYGQISAAYGMFYEDPSDRYLLFGHKGAFQEATHYILNYQFMKDDRTFRVEGYYKSYSDLIREITEGPYDPNPYRLLEWPTNNTGYGYAQGVDVFWRDKKSIKNFDYWISYSYIDTKRLYENYVTEATPNFVSKNNLNIVTKYFFDKPGINISLTYTYASGKPYYNPDNPVFLGDLSPPYQDLAASISYLFRVKKLFGVWYVGIDNITNNQNILGYYYSDNGETRVPIVPALYRSFFTGILLSLTPYKKEEL